ncbi:MAG: GNAT family N-acetyltransferase [Planctomycetia bacterium]|nr:GNAT family N-acetyltransferase [Planctomycetia bacterium]
MYVEQVTTERELREFIRVPVKIYRGNPNWVRPLDYDLRERLDERWHPFYDHGWARKFLVRDGGTAVGRVLVADDPRFNAENGSNQGTFGFFESVDDQQVANLLLDTCANELSSRGRDTLFGPVEYSTNYECGLLIKGYDEPPSLLMPYNQPYYQRLLETWGLCKNKDLFAWQLDDPSVIMERWPTLLNRFEQRYPISIRPFALDNFTEDLQKCIQVYEAVRKDWWWACVSMTKKEIENYARLVRLMTPADLVLLAEDQGQPVGFCLAAPNYNEAIKPLNGSLSFCGVPWLGLPRLLWRTKKIQSIRLMVLCLLPQYQHRGIAERLIYQVVRNCLEHHSYCRGELGWTDEKNDRINRIIKRVGGRCEKVFRVYERKLQP